MITIKKIIRNGLIDENPIFIQVIGICPTLAVTTSISNAIGMGLASAASLVLANIFISLVGKHTPSTVRIPVFIIVIASAVTVIQFLLHAFFPNVYASLGIFIPLIIVNCVILARAEGFASKHNPLLSAIDGISMGLGFTIALCAVAFFREIIGNGTILGFTVIPEQIPRMYSMLMAPGAFFTLATIMVVINYFKGKGGAKT